ncbi:MAG: hypothetical protein GC160_02840 [Acidobacteria bacterium]|nr:hypothetical protein [Acidobacteriota bacterium]
MTGQLDLFPRKPLTAQQRRELIRERLYGLDVRQRARDARRRERQERRRRPERSADGPAQASLFGEER